MQVLHTGDLPALAGVLSEVQPLSPGNTTNRAGAANTPLGPSDAAMARAAALVTAEASGARALFHTPGVAGGRGVAGTTPGGSMATPGGGNILGKSNTELYALYMNMVSSGSEHNLHTPMDILEIQESKSLPGQVEGLLVCATSASYPTQASLLFLEASSPSQANHPNGHSSAAVLPKQGLFLPREGS